MPFCGATEQEIEKEKLSKRRRFEGGLGGSRGSDIFMTYHATACSRGNAVCSVKFCAVLCSVVQCAVYIVVECSAVCSVHCCAVHCSSGRAVQCAGGLCSKEHWPMVAGHCRVMETVQCAVCSVQGCSGVQGLHTARCTL